MLAGDGAAEADGQLHDFAECEVGALGLIGVRGVEDDQRVGVAVTGVRDHRDHDVALRGYRCHPSTSVGS